MKHILATLLLTAAATYTCAATPQQPDTVLSVNSPTTVTLTEAPSGFNLAVISKTADGETRSDYTESFDRPVRIEARRNHGSLSIVNTGNSPWDLNVGGPGIGWVNACGQPDGTGIEMGKSLEISWLNALAVSYRMPWKSSRLTLGFGFTWRNYRISTSQNRFIPTENGGVATGQYPDDVEAKGSRLKVFSLGVPLLWHQTLPFRFIGDNCSLRLGAVFNYNPHASMKTKWETPDGEKAEQVTDHIGQRRFTIDFMAALHIGYGLNLYVKYSPNSVLRGSGQPSFTPLSSGLILFL